MDFELLEKAGMTKYEMAKNDPFCFFMRSIVAGLYLGLATILSYTLAVLLIGHHVIASKNCICRSIWNRTRYYCITWFRIIYRKLFYHNVSSLS